MLTRCLYYGPPVAVEAMIGHQARELKIDKMSAKHKQNPLRYECLLRGSFLLINWHTFQGETRALCIMHTSLDNALYLCQQCFLILELINFTPFEFIPDCWKLGWRFNPTISRERGRGEDLKRVLWKKMGFCPNKPRFLVDFQELGASSEVKKGIKWGHPLPLQTKSAKQYLKASLLGSP